MGSKKNVGIERYTNKNQYKGVIEGDGADKMSREEGKSASRSLWTSSSPNPLWNM